MKRYCSECNNELEDWEDDLCQDCSLSFAGSVIHTNGIFPDETDMM